MKRQLFIATSLTMALAGCSGVTNKLNESEGVKRIVDSVEGLDHAIIGSRGRAKLYADSDIDKEFRMNGFDTPADSTYQGFLRDRFAAYKLVVNGEVEKSQTFTLGHLRAMASLTQTTRHDCVEGWSAIGKWTGVPLAAFVALVRPTDKARFVVFHCMDHSPDGDPYYESLDLAQAAHPQTLLALDLNGKALDADHGAPVRLRVPTQLGYKSAKWINRIELASTLPKRGGYWEDQGYEWFAGI